MHSLWLRETSLICGGHFWSEKVFHLALLMGVVGLSFAWVVFPDAFRALKLSIFSLFLLMLWQPLVEEIFFRGILQRELLKWEPLSHAFLGISQANLLVSILFVFAHLFSHSAWWAMGVFLPSLIFGWFRDHYQCVYPSILLHSFYNFLFFGFSVYLIE